MPEASGGIKRGALWPPLKRTLEKYNFTTAAWEPMDLTTATAVKVYLSSVNTPGTVIHGTCTFVKDAKGEVEYPWEAGDTALADSYEGEFVITWANGKEQIVPRVGYFSFVIEPNLAAAE